VVAMSDALQKAREASLDLVEIAPTANPPVCRIMNFGKFIYQQKKKQQDSKKKQKTTLVKEVKFRPNIDDHDYDFKVKNIVKFLAHGDKVKATVQFRGREMARRENGQKVLDRLLQDLAGKAVAESRSEMLGNRLYQILAPVRVHEKGGKPAPAPARAAER
jgi:translation initiation factor IF-3